MSDILLVSGVRLRPFPGWVNRLSRLGVGVLPRGLVERMEAADAEMHRDLVALSDCDSFISRRLMPRRDVNGT